MRGGVVKQVAVQVGRRGAVTVVGVERDAHDALTDGCVGLTVHALSSRRSTAMVGRAFVLAVVHDDSQTRDV